MRLKTVNLLFIILISCLTVACVVHTAISYVSIANDQMTSAPPRVAFFLMIPYGFFLLILAIAWLIIARIYKKRNKTETK